MRSKQEHHVVYTKAALPSSSVRVWDGVHHSLHEISADSIVTCSVFCQPFHLPDADVVALHGRLDLSAGRVRSALTSCSAFRKKRRSKDIGARDVMKSARK